MGCEVAEATDAIIFCFVCSKQPTNQGMEKVFEERGLILAAIAAGELSALSMVISLSCSKVGCELRSKILRNARELLGSMRDAGKGSMLYSSSLL